ncbi:ParA family protein [Deinococcus frigens]|uniref:ParA family protein n=1 Tax=Deinococcus frigens TaxID=249403 RepID=UPI0004970F2E|nr:ParA family protein [Deinococcus frigens]
MEIFSIANMKGGVGKTTTAIQIAQGLGKKGKTLLLDADQELQCAVAWRSSDNPAWSFDVARYDGEATKRMKGYEYVVIDSKGNEQGHDLVSLARASDLLIVPTRPEGVSATGLANTLSPLVDAGIQNFRVLVVVNEGGRGEELREHLAESGIPVFTSMVRKSTAVGDAAEQRIPLEAYTQNRYARTVALEYQSVMREALSYVR